MSKENGAKDNALFKMIRRGKTVNRLSAVDANWRLWSLTKTGSRSSRALTTVVVALQSSLVLDRPVSSVSSSLFTLPGLDITVEASVLSLSSEIKNNNIYITEKKILEVAGIHVTYLWIFFLLSELFSILFYTFLISPLQCTL